MTGKIAVLGANGFIGSRIVEMFHLAGLAEVCPVVRSFASLARLSRFELDHRIADAFDLPALRSAFAGCEVVVHAVAGDRRTILETLAPTYQAAQAAGVRRLVYLSTASVHGQVPAPGTDEDSPLSDRQALPYNNAKVQAERQLRQLRDKGSVELVILRPGIVFGPRAYWVASFAEELLAGKAYLMNKGRGICNSIYIDNLVHAIFLAATTPAVDRQVFLVGDQEEVTWADLYRPIAEALGFDLAQVPEATMISENSETWLQRFDTLRTSKPAQLFLSLFPMKLRQAAFMTLATFKESPPPSPWTLPGPQLPIATQERVLLYQCQYKLPCHKARATLGYQPIVSFAEGCRRTVAWLAFAGYPVVERQP